MKPLTSSSNRQHIFSYILRTPEVITIPTETGAWIGGRKASFTIKGENCYALMSNILSLMDGNTDIDAALQKLPNETLQQAIKLISVLVERGFAILLPSSLKSLEDRFGHFAAFFIRHFSLYTTHPIDALKELLSENIVFCGSQDLIDLASEICKEAGLPNKLISSYKPEELLELKDPHKKLWMIILTDNLEEYQLNLVEQFVSKNASIKIAYTGIVGNSLWNLMLGGNRSISWTSFSERIVSTQLKNIDSQKVAIRLGLLSLLQDIIDTHCKGYPPKGYIPVSTVQLETFDLKKSRILTKADNVTLLSKESFLSPNMLKEPIRPFLPDFLNFDLDKFSGIETVASNWFDNKFGPLISLSHEGSQIPLGSAKIQFLKANSKLNDIDSLKVFAISTREARDQAILNSLEAMLTNECISSEFSGIGLGWSISEAIGRAIDKYLVDNLSKFSTLKRTPALSDISDKDDYYEELMYIINTEQISLKEIISNATVSKVGPVKIFSSVYMGQEIVGVGLSLSSAILSSVLNMHNSRGVFTNIPPKKGWIEYAPFSSLFTVTDISAKIPFEHNGIFAVQVNRKSTL